jgi:hypothetical protein
MCYPCKLLLPLLVKHLVFNTTVVLWLACWLYILRFKSWQEKQIFHISITSKLALVPTQWVLGFCPRVKVALSMMTTYYHLEPVLIMCGAVPSVTLTYASIECTGATLPFLPFMCSMLDLSEFHSLQVLVPFTGLCLNTTEGVKFTCSCIAM